MSHNYHFFFMVRTFKISFLSNFQVYNLILLSINIMLSVRFQAVFSCYNWKFVTFEHLPIFPTLQPVIYIIALLCFSEFNQIPHISVIIEYCPSLTYFTQHNAMLLGVHVAEYLYLMFSLLIHTIRKGEISHPHCLLWFFG